MSTRYKGSFMSSTAAPTSTSAAPGIWRSNDVMQALQAATWPRANSPTAVDYLVVAGGGGGGSGGGGAGGFRTATAFAVSSGLFTVTVGAGGNGCTNLFGTGNQTDGGNSVFSSITSTGGGYGASYTNPGGAPSGQGHAGGSGGGGYYLNNTGGGAGTSGQGNNGGAGQYNGGYGIGGGGGGAGSVGQDASYTGTDIAAFEYGGNGGSGSSSSISGASVTYAGGGGGTADGRCAYYQAGSGGSGGGGAGGAGDGVNGSAGTANTGGGGGGAGIGPSIIPGNGGNGGSGIVIIRYPDTYDAASATTGSPTVTVTGGYRIYKWTSSGSITF